MGWFHKSILKRLNALLKEIEQETKSLTPENTLKTTRRLFDHAIRVLRFEKQIEKREVYDIRSISGVIEKIIIKQIKHSKGYSFLTPDINKNKINKIKDEAGIIWRLLNQLNKQLDDFNIFLEDLLALIKWHEVDEIPFGGGESGKRKQERARKSDIDHYLEFGDDGYHQRISSTVRLKKSPIILIKEIMVTVNSIHKYIDKYDLDVGEFLDKLDPDDRLTNITNKLKRNLEQINEQAR